MTFLSLIQQNLKHYWRTNLAVVLGVATAVAVLAGALLVGASVRGSLRDLALQRLGKTDFVIAGNKFFRAALAADMQQHSEFTANFVAAAPLIALPAVVTHSDSNARAGNVMLYGVDDQFWQFHGVNRVAGNEDDAMVSPALARELSAKPDDTLVIRIEKPSAIPLESLHGRKDEAGTTLRLSLREVLPAEQMGEFSLRPQQGVVRAVFVSLKKLQKNIGQEGKANTLLLAAKNPQADVRQVASKVIQERFQLADLGLKLRLIEDQKMAVLETDSAVLDDKLAKACIRLARKNDILEIPVLTYLANKISVGNRSIPYSLVTATSLFLDPMAHVQMRGTANNFLAQGELEKERKELTGENEPRIELLLKGDAMQPFPLPKGYPPPPPELAITLNEWAAKDLGAKKGDVVTLEYFVWQEGGQLITQTAKFSLAKVVPLRGALADRTFAPDYPGITDTNSLADWDPPFPVELDRVRPIDEEYWKQYRTTPKAFILLEKGQELWGTRYGKLTSIRFMSGPQKVAGAANTPTDPEAYWPTAANTRERLEKVWKEQLDPLQFGLNVMPVKSDSQQAARGATDFGEYFSYFSFFLVISALLLTGLFFKLGVEQRLREIGLLQALGFTPAQVRSLFLREGLLLAVIGSLLGVLGALAYGALIMWGLRTWWVGAVGTTLLRLHIAPSALLIGLASGIVTALGVVWWTLRSLRHVAPRSLLSGAIENVSTMPSAKRRNFRWLAAAGFGVVALLMLILSASKTIDATGGFFGAGFCLLIAALCGWSAWLRQPRARTVQTNGWQGVTQLGFRNATVRAGRSVLCIALIASASFIIVAVDAFRRDGKADVNDKKSGTGGFALYAEALLPLVRDPNSAQGRDELNLSDDALKGVNFTRFRLRPGDDASCLNLYAPRNPRILGVPKEFIQQGRFTFASSEARTPEEKANPWLLLNSSSSISNLKFEIPVIGDANSLTYVLHKSVGDTLEMNDERGLPIKLRVVAALQDSLLQGELLMADSQFTRLFPSIAGQRVFLIEAAQPATVSPLLEDRLSDYGFDAESTATRLASFHQVENTYLSTFQALGALGLLLGTVGLAAVLLRNVLERRRELALLRATGYQPQHLSWLILAENLLLLGCGLLTGIVCALIAIAPAMMGRGGRVSLLSLGLLLATVLFTGLAVSWIAVRAAVKAPLLPALRAE